MKKYVLVALFLVSSQLLWAQANIIFSLPQRYEFTVQLGEYNFHRPQTWQIKFENIPAGNHVVTVTVSRPNSSYRVTQKFNLTVAAGYESTYFIMPYEKDLDFHLANYYTIQQVYGKEYRNETRNEEPSRLTEFNGRKVLSKKDLEAFYFALKKQEPSGNQLVFAKAEMPLFYFYTEDIIYLLYVVPSESQKLDIAKFAYDHCIDPEQYFKFGKVLSGSDYMQLSNYLKTKRK
jgi:hypothetical protein